MADAHVFQPVELDDILEGAFRFGGDTWALLSAGDEEKVNTMTVSWGGLTYVWNKTCAVVFVRESRYTKEFIDKQKKLSLSFLNRKEYKGLKNYLGTVSGRDEDKIEKAGIHVDYYEGIPYIDEADSVIIGKVLFKSLMKEDNFVNGRLIADHYAKGDYHWIYLAELKQVMIR